MPSRDRRIDAYIARSAEFARPILAHLREVVHEACPEVEETIKWGMPSFEYRGPLCSMAAFKQHCTFGFWKGALLVGANGGRADEAMGQFGRISKRSDLPSKRTIAGYVKKAMKLNEAGVKVERKTTPRKPIPVPADLRAALAHNPRAKATFEGFSPSHRRDYLEWITEAKREETRLKRLETAVEWMAAGKPRHWQYQKKAK